MTVSKCLIDCSHIKTDKISQINTEIDSVETAMHYYSVSAGKYVRHYGQSRPRIIHPRVNTGLGIVYFVFLQKNIRRIWNETIRRNRF